MYFKKNVTFVILVFLVTTAALCSGKQEENINTKAKASHLRVISLAPNITEIIFALGKESNLVGRTNYCNYPPGVLDIVSVGEMMEPNIEMILKLEPDIVLASTHAQKDVAAKIEEFGIKLIYLYYDNSLEGVYSTIKTIGDLLGAEIESETVIESMKNRYNKVEQKTEKILKKPTVYYVVGFGEGGEWTAGGKTFIGQMIKAAGGNNIAAAVNGWSFSLETLIKSDPDIILINGSMYDGFIKTMPYSELSAVKNNNVYIINEDLINRPGPRVIEGVELLNELFTKK